MSLKNEMDKKIVSEKIRLLSEELHYQNLSAQREVDTEWKLGSTERRSQLKRDSPLFGISQDHY
jgi:hypothetical protein